MLLCARYVLPVSGPVIEDGAVLVAGDAIAAVGPRAGLLRDHPGEEVVDYGVAALMPGFVDLHTHLEYSIFRGVVDDLPYTRWKMEVQRREARLTGSDWADSATLGAIEAVRSGITTIADVTSSGVSVAAAQDAGLRGVIYREISTMDVSAVERVIGEALDDIEAWGERVDPGRLTVGIAPHAPYTCHPRLFQAMVAAVGDRDLPVAMHLAGSRDEYDFVKYGSSPLGQDFREQSGWAGQPWMPTGVSPVRYVHQWGVFGLPNVLAVHCVHVDAEDIAILEANDVAIAHCPRCNAKLGMGTAPLGEFIARKFRVGLGTDSPASNSTMDVFDEMRVGVLIHRSLTGERGFFSADTFLSLATIGGARALRLDGRIGTLEPGKAADIIAVDLSQSYQAPAQNPAGALVHTANQEDVLMTMVAGRVLYDRGRFTTIDPEALRERTDELRAKVGE